MTFGEARVVSASTEVGAAPTFAVGPDGRRAVAWVSAPGGGTDGRLYVAPVGADGALGATAELRDALGPIEPHGEAPPKLAFAPSGALYALWVVGKDVPGRRFPMSALRFARSDDGGRTWTAPASVTDLPQPFGSFNFHALQAGRGDTVYATWLDGRAGKSATFMTRSTDGGRTWAPNVRVDPAGEACPCCRTAVVAGRGDTVYAAWRKVFPGNVRQVVVARSADGGRTWAAPVAAQRDGWVIDGCPHAGPSLQVDAAGRVHVAWWTGKEGAAGVFYARSDDGGRTFGAPAPLGVATYSRPAHVQLALDAAPNAAPNAEPTVVATWDDGTVRQPRVLVRVSRDGGATFGPASEASAPGRSATFPVLAAHAGRVTLAWNEEAGSVEEHHHAARDTEAHQPLPSVGRKTIVMRDGRL
ncbi:putative cytochrome c biogenesis protein [Gemmatirosa kalamazoonensis]|uniref:Putative cytochrome c biogenesis protein n=1 Tax=Gemmatirosa kalamazoonensis TaxID=861299 RepID=W0RBL1_9BACT|nr:sialidase family protein [Gemmatirosa kalamazoonensis]AHG87690.1 putative cytochrome c biogenesis protein [Gemmatirosa kalamazoonensis]